MSDGTKEMNVSEATIGTRVRSLIDFQDVPKGTVGVIDEDYGTGVMVAWDLPERPLPRGYRRHDGRAAIASGKLRDGFNKEYELKFLEVIK